VKRTLWAAGLTHLTKHPGQLALALVGLALGVATITAVDLATQSASRAFALSLEAVSGPATHELTSGPAGIDERLYVRLATEHPRIAFAPIVEGYVSVGDEALDLAGVDPLAEATFAVRSGEVASGAGLGASRMRGFEQLERWLTEPGAVVVAGAAARWLHLRAGRAFELDVGGHVRRAVPIATPETAGEGGASLLLTDIAQAQEWLGLDGRLSRIELDVPPGADGEAALARLERELPAGVALEAVGRRSAQSLDMTRAFSTNLRAMSLLALLVGLLLIYSAVSFAVLQRRKTFATLRALGATRLDIVTLVATEAAALGALGAVAGLIAGDALARGLLVLVSRTPRSRRSPQGCSRRSRRRRFRRSRRRASRRSPGSSAPRSSRAPAICLGRSRSRAPCSRSPQERSSPAPAAASSRDSRRSFSCSSASRRSLRRCSTGRRVLRRASPDG